MLLSSCCCFFFFFSSRRRHTRCSRDWSSDVCSSDLMAAIQASQRLREVIAQAVARKLEVEPGALAFRERKVGVAADWERAVPFAQAVELAQTMHRVLAVPAPLAPPEPARRGQGRGGGPAP